MYPTISTKGTEVTSNGVTVGYAGCDKDEDYFAVELVVKGPEGDEPLSRILDILRYAKITTTVNKDGSFSPVRKGEVSEATYVDSLGAMLHGWAWLNGWL